MKPDKIYRNCSVTLAHIAFFLFYSCVINPSVEKCSVPLEISTEDIRNLEILNDLIFRYEDVLKQISCDAGPERDEKPDNDQFFYTCPVYIYQAVSAEDSVTFNKTFATLNRSLNEKDWRAGISSIDFHPGNSVILYELLVRRCSGGKGKVYVHHQLQYNPEHVKRGKEEVRVINENWQYLISVEEDSSGCFP